ncbi:MAG: ABC transporter transmembrane domain-containing protein [Bacteroidota bacterium]|nr:ABC transporter transmembrane domain-containing protein [Bacteroidota bacterium]
MERTEEEARKFNWKNWGAVRKMGHYLRPHAWGYALGVLIISLSGVLTLLVTRLWGQLGGVGASTGEEAGVESPMAMLNIDMHSLTEVGWLILLVLAVQATLSFGRVLLFAKMTEDMMLAMRNDAFEAIVSMPMKFFDTRRVGDLNSRVSADITAIQDVFTTTLAELLRQIIIIVGGILALLYFSVTLTLLMLATLPVMIIAAILFGRFIRKLSKRTQDQVAESNTIVQETLTGIISVKSFANEAWEVVRYVNSIKDIRSLAMRGAIWRGAFASFIILFIFGAITLVIFKGAELMMEGGLASEHFFTFLLMTGLVAGSIGGIAAQFSALQRGLGAIESLMELMEESREEVVTQQDQAYPALQLRGDVSFEDVHFHYANRADVNVLTGVNLRIEPGKRVALVGPSGAGKSTIASLLQRFHDPTAGMIKVDGQPLDEYDLTGFRKRIAFVPQEVILFGGDIRSNIAYGKTDASDAAIRSAAEQANALGFIESFPDGFATVVGERGVQLSGGQRQRIAIARAILRDPDILILDEATSALDASSEKEVQLALDALMKDRSSLIIAHRLSTIKNADQIAVLSEGTILEIGTHDTLIAGGGAYKKLVENQEFDLA